MTLRDVKNTVAIRGSVVECAGVLALSFVEVRPVNNLSASCEKFLKT